MEVSAKNNHTMAIYCMQPLRTTRLLFTVALDLQGGAWSELVLDIQACHWRTSSMPPFEGTALPIQIGMNPLRQHIQAPGDGLHDRVHGVRAQANELSDAKQRIPLLMAASDCRDG